MTSLSVRRVVSVAAAVLAVVLLGAFVVQAVPGLVGADASYVVLSGSMEPAISPGDAVVVDSVAPADIERGDVITYTRTGESTPITHRVVDVIEADGTLAFRTKGDANDAPDPAPVPAERVTGEVWFVIPYVGHVVLFANTPTGLGVLVGLPVGAFLLTELYAFARGESTDDAADGATDEPAADAAVTESSAAAADAESPADEADGGAVVVTATDLKLSSVGFGALAAYSGYVAYLDPTPLHVAVFAAAAMVVVFAGTMLAFDSAESGTERETRVEDAPAGDSEEATTDGGTAVRAVRGGDGDGA